MYAYKPKSLWSLSKLIDREILGQQARYERFMANMLFILASGKHIDMDQSPDFKYQVDEAFKNPFVERKQAPQTAEEIKQYILQRLGE